ncbi:hypothetical protein [Parasphingorhabdus sp.]|uniref:hypothetical protein n=1 Tax=Parasphingorhabdus sp. TaxID=2709688 RepID=UPI003BB1E425
MSELQLETLAGGLSAARSKITAKPVGAALWVQPSLSGAAPYLLVSEPSPPANRLAEAVR